METILEMKGISKQYPGVRALDQISILFRRGEVHALLGENGAGKSTLIKVLSGAIEPSEGSIFYDGMEYKKLTPAISKKLGISVIYQEFNLIPTLSIAENIYLNQMDKGKWMINRKAMAKQAAEVLAELGILLDPELKVRDLSIAHQQLVEIAKAFSDDVRILIMDEPTAPLTDTEVKLLFDLVHSMKKRGVTIIYISHRLEELFEIADRVTVLRDGQFVTTKEIDGTDTEELIRLMVGRPLTDQYPKRTPEFGEILLEARGIYAKDLVKNAGFSVRAGEILGIAGLVGAGRTELIRAVYGADRKQAGEIYMENRKVSLKSPTDAIKRGIALIPEDRKSQGALLGMNIVENIALSSVKRFSSLSVINKKKLLEMVQGYVKKTKDQDSGYLSNLTKPLRRKSAEGDYRQMPGLTGENIPF